MVQTSLMKEVERLKQNLLLQGQKLDAAQQRVAELETQLSKKEHLIAEQKKFLEDVKGQAKYVVYVCIERRTIHILYLNDYV